MYLVIIWKFFRLLNFFGVIVVIVIFRRNKFYNCCFVLYCIMKLRLKGLRLKIGFNLIDVDGL